MLKKCLLSISALALIGGGIIATAPPSAAIGGVSDGASRSRGKDQPADLFGDAGIFTRVSNIMLFLVGAIAVIMIIFGGIRYVVSGGNSSQVQGAKNTIMYALVGVVVTLLAYAAVNFVINTIIPGGNINTTTNSSNTGASTT